MLVIYLFFTYASTPFIRLPFSGIPVEHPMKDLLPKDDLVGPVIGKAKDPFIYNPRLKSLASTKVSRTNVYFFWILAHT